MWEAVRGLVASGTDVLLTTHYLEEADELADQVVVIDHGEAIASGTVGELKASIGKDVIEVMVADPVDLQRVGQILERVTTNVPQLERTGRRVTAPTSNCKRQLAAVVNLLDDHDIAVDEVGLRRPTLDEVFLTLTRHEIPVPALAGAAHDGSAA